MGNVPSQIRLQVTDGSNEGALLRRNSELRFLFRLVFSCVALVSLVLNMVDTSRCTLIAAAVSCVLLSVYLLIIVRRNWFLLVPFSYIFLCVYSSCYTNYLSDYPIGFYAQFRESGVSSTALNVLLLFMVTLTLCMPQTINNPFKNNRICIISLWKKSAYACIACLVFLAFFGVVSITGSSGIGDRMSVNTYYEYSQIFLILALILTGGERKLLIACGAVLAFRVLLDFAIGGRVTAIEMCCGFFLACFSHRARLTRVLPVIAMLFVATLTVGKLRGSAFELEMALKGIVDFANAGFSWDGAYAAYHTSECYVAYRELFNIGYDISGLVEFLLSMIVGTSSGLWAPTDYVTSIFPNQGGGYLPFFFYFYLGYVGAVISGIVTALVLRLLVNPVEEGKPLRFVVRIWISCTVFRWFSYNPVALVRGVAIIVIVYVAITLLALGRKRQPSSNAIKGAPPS